MPRTYRIDVPIQLPLRIQLYWVVNNVMLIQHFSIKSKEHIVNHIFLCVVKRIDQQVELDYHLSALLVMHGSTNSQMASECALLDWISNASLPGSHNPAGILQALYTRRTMYQNV